MQRGQLEVLISCLPGFPDGVSVSEDGNFWIALVAPDQPFVKILPYRYLQAKCACRCCLGNHSFIGFLRYVDQQRLMGFMSGLTPVSWPEINVIRLRRWDFCTLGLGLPSTSICGIACLFAMDDQLMLLLLSMLALKPQ